MSDRKVKNISTLQHPLLVRVLNPSGTEDIIVLLSPGEVFWCPKERETKPLVIYEKRGFLECVDEAKPIGATYYESYPSDYWTDENIGAPTDEKVEPENVPDELGELEINGEVEAPKEQVEIEVPEKKEPERAKVKKAKKKNIIPFRVRVKHKRKITIDHEAIKPNNKQKKVVVKSEKTEKNPTTEPDKTVESDKTLDSENKQKRWEETELEWLKENYPKSGLSYCADHLGRSPISIKKKTLQLHLKREK